MFQNPCLFRFSYTLAERWARAQNGGQDFCSKRHSFRLAFWAEIRLQKCNIIKKREFLKLNIKRFSYLCVSKRTLCSGPNSWLKLRRYLDCYHPFQFVFRFWSAVSFFLFSIFISTNFRRYIPGVRERSSCFFACLYCHKRFASPLARVQPVGARTTAVQWRVINVHVIEAYFMIAMLYITVLPYSSVAPNESLLYCCVKENKRFISVLNKQSQRVLYCHGLAHNWNRLENSRTAKLLRVQLTGLVMIERI